MPDHPCPKCTGTGVIATCAVTPPMGVKLMMTRCGCVPLTRRQFDEITEIIGDSFRREWNRRMPEMQQQIDRFLTDGAPSDTKPRGLFS